MNIVKLFGKIVLGLVLYYLLIHDSLNAILLEYKRRAWISLEGKAEEIFLKEKPHSRFKRYESVFLLYSYEIDGKRYYGTDVLKEEGMYYESDTDEAIIQREGKEYPAGKRINIRVDPENKEESTSAIFSDRFVLLFLLGIGVEIVLLRSILQDWKKSSRKV